MDDPVYKKLDKAIIAYNSNYSLRYNATSGGYISGLLYMLFEKNIIKSGISFSRKGIEFFPEVIYDFRSYQMTGSIYQEINLSAFIKENIKRLISPVFVTCLPCQVRPIRNIFKKKRLKCLIASLVCSGQMSLSCTKDYIDLHGLSDEEIVFFKYRGGGWPGTPMIRIADGRAFEDSLLWSYFFNSFFYHQKRCLSCSDTFGVNADFAVSDPWLGERVKDEKIGKSIVFIYTTKAARIHSEMVADNIVIEEAISKAEAIGSQQFTLNRKSLIAKKNCYKVLINIIHRSRIYKGIVVKNKKLIEIHAKIVQRILRHGLRSTKTRETNITNLLLINQHASNHGDESALRALLERVNPFQYKVSILYNCAHDEGLFPLERKIHEYVLSKNVTLTEKILIFLTFVSPIHLIKAFYTSQLKKEFLLIHKADLVVNSPGGANLGVYKDWRYLWRLFLAQKLKKRVAIYSTSIGPFPKRSAFSAFTRKVLKKLDYFSLRDAQSFRYARELNIDFIESIDTAFLSSSGEKLPNSILSDVQIPFPKGEFAVFVPNELNRWHPNFRNITPLRVKKFYCEILNFLMQNVKSVVLLPQLFGTSNDKSYFETIKNMMDSSFHSRIFIVNENYNSEVQQKIISLSKCVVGARYHSIVFSINNCVPFLCLSYEHKMENMVELLNLSDFSIPLKEIFYGSGSGKHMEKAYAIISRITMSDSLTIDNITAKKIAEKSFKIFENDFLNRYHID